MAGDSHYFFVLAKTGLIFCKIPKVFLIWMVGKMGGFGLVGVGF
jgi:hypothetical protein